jgi:hypothetical protein
MLRLGKFEFFLQGLQPCFYRSVCLPSWSMRSSRLLPIERMARLGKRIETKVP